MSDDVRRNLFSITADLVAARVARNRVPAADLPALIAQIYHSLASAVAPKPEVPPRPTPAAPIHKSVEADFIICLEDGKKLKTLRRHLMAAYNLTPEAYRARWGLPPDYPMVAPNYAERRSALAKAFGLGRQNRTDD
jgi:predicted transcriptional regulator